MAGRGASGVQVVKSGSGDLMLVLPISKSAATAMTKNRVMVAIGAADELRAIRRCLARYDAFRLKPDLVVNPIADIAKK